MLYYAPGSCALASHAALEEAGAEFKAVRLNLAAGEQRGADFLAINPRGRVPALVADGQLITETIAVLTYVAHRFPQAGLLPLGDPLKLARAYEVMSWFASSAHVSIAQIWRTERFTTDEACAQQLKIEGRTNVLRAFEEIETLAGAGRWLLGDTFSVLDPYALVFWRWGTRLEADMSRYPNWEIHTRSLMERPAIARALEREAAPAVEPA